MVTYPNFTFSYPDGWNVTEQDVTSQQEVGTISNDRGVTVTFMHIDGTPGGLGAGSSVSAARVEVSKVGRSSRALFRDMSRTQIMQILVHLA